MLYRSKSNCDLDNVVGRVFAIAIGRALANHMEVRSILEERLSNVERAVLIKLVRVWLMYSGLRERMGSE